MRIGASSGGLKLGLEEALEKGGDMSFWVRQLAEVGVAKELDCQELVAHVSGPLTPWAYGQPLETLIT